MIAWKDLTPTQRHALIRATGQGIAPKDLPLQFTVPTATGDDTRTVTITAKVLHELERHGLAHLTVNRRKRATWRPTDSGRGLVASRGLLPTFLHRRSEHGYTSSYHQAMTGEPEAIRDAA
jgi:hypothetical protein